MVCERPWFQVLVGTRIFTTCPNVTGGENSSINQDSEPGPLVYCAMHGFNHWAIDTLYTDWQLNTKHQRCVQQSKCSGALAKICVADLENLVKILENLVSTYSAKRCHVEEFSVEDEDFFFMYYFIPIDSDFYASSEGDHTPSSYLRTILPKWKKLVQTSQLKPGSPLVLIITSSAIRAVHLNRYKHYLWIIQ